MIVFILYKFVRPFLFLKFSYNKIKSEIISEFEKLEFKKLKEFEIPFHQDFIKFSISKDIPLNKIKRSNFLGYYLYKLDDTSYIQSESQIVSDQEICIPSFVTKNIIEKYYADPLSSDQEKLENDIYKKIKTRSISYLDFIFYYINMFFAILSFLAPPFKKLFYKYF